MISVTIPTDDNTVFRETSRVRFGLSADNLLLSSCTTAFNCYRFHACCILRLRKRDGVYYTIIIYYNVDKSSIRSSRTHVIAHML